MEMAWLFPDRLCCYRQELGVGFCWTLLDATPLAAVPHGQGENGNLGGPRLTLRNIRVWDTGAGEVCYR